MELLVISLNSQLLVVIMSNYLEAQSPSGTSTPVFSWSPLPQRKKFNFTNEKFAYQLNEDDNCYPNCDVDVWLRSCEEEIKEPLKGETKGIIPKWLKGSLIRNGPGSLKVGDEEFSHLFDSSALLHRFHIENGTVTYQCRFLQSEIYKRNWTAKRIVQTEFGTKATVPDPCQTIFQKVAAIFKPEVELSDNAMISVYPFGDELYAFNEIPIIHKINGETLETEGRVDISKNVSIVNHTSHPHVMNDGTVYNLGLSIYLTGPYHSIVSFPTEFSGETKFEKAKIVASIPARWPLHPSYMHTWGVTDNYFLIVEQPLNLSVPAIISTRINSEPLAGCFRWYHDEYTQINVVSRETGKLAYKFYAQSFFYLHLINQYEIDDYIVLDICMYRDPAMLDCMYIETMKSMQKNPDYAKMFRGRPARFVLPLKPPSKHSVNPNKNLISLKHSKAKATYLENGEILLKAEKLCNLGCETPRINYETFLGKPYRYFYAISSDVDAENPGTIIKVDTYTKTAKTWCEKNCYPSEPIFVPNNNSKSEDDGVVLAALVWGWEDTNHAGLIILDAKSFKEIARTEFRTPTPVPKCLHGWFIPQKSTN